VCYTAEEKKTMNHRRVLVNELRITKAHGKKKGKPNFFFFFFNSPSKNSKPKKSKTLTNGIDTHTGEFYIAPDYDSALIIL
jgi:hypothetical protein